MHFNEEPVSPPCPLYGTKITHKCNMRTCSVYTNQRFSNLFFSETIFKFLLVSMNHILLDFYDIPKTGENMWRWDLITLPPDLPWIPGDLDHFGNHWCWLISFHVFIILDKCDRVRYVIEYFTRWDLDPSVAF